MEKTGNLAADAVPDQDGFEDIARPRHGTRDWLLLGGGCLLMAAILRFLRLGYREFFADEFTTLELLSGHREGLFLGGVLHGDFSIYHLMVRGWAALAGNTTEAVLRFPSAVFGLLACVAFFLFSRSYLRGTALTICVLVFALNPILVATSIEAGPFSLLVLATVVANYFAIRALDLGGKGNWIAYGVSMALGALTHPLFWFLMPAHFIFALLRGRRTPSQFIKVSIAGLVLCVVVGGVLAAVGSRSDPDTVGVQTPSSSDLVRSLVAVLIGNFPRYEANDFARGVMYIFLVGCLALSVVYYRKRSAEALAMPENVVWIDETQDVVGTWKRLSLRAFLLFQWLTFVVPVAGIFILAGFVPDLRLRPELFVVALPPLVVLVAMGIDAAPRGTALALGMLLILGMTYYDKCALSDRGYGVAQAFRHINEEKFNPERDLVLYTAPRQLNKPVRYYRGSIDAVSFPSFDDNSEYDDRLARASTVVKAHERVFVIYHRDLRPLNKRGERSPLRDWFADPKNGYELDKKWEKLSNEENTELRIYRRKGSPAVL